MKRMLCLAFILLVMVSLTANTARAARTITWGTVKKTGLKKAAPPVIQLTSNVVIATSKMEILFDGEKIHGLKGVTYKVYKDRQDVRGIGMNDRMGVLYGLMHVRGKILVHSNSELLNKHMENNTSFQIILSIMQDSYPEVHASGQHKFMFQKCRINDCELLDDFFVYSFTAKGVGGVFLTADGMVTPAHLMDWELDENDESLNTVIMVTDGADLIGDIKIEQFTFDQALDYIISSPDIS
jgi:hypothetical protein